MKKTTTIKNGTRVTFKGDMANLPGAGRVIDRLDSEWGSDYRVVLDAEPSKFGEGLPERDFWVTANALRDASRWTIGGVK